MTDAISKPRLPEEWSPPLVALIGMGMGRGDLGRDALSWLNRAQVLAGGRRHMDLFPDIGEERILLQAPLDDALERLAEVCESKRAAVLASGDPFFFGIGRRLVKRLGRERIYAFPNITSVQALFARLGESWEDLKVVSLHGREARFGRSGWINAVRSAQKTALFTDPKHTPAWIAKKLLAAGICDIDMVVGENLGLSEESVRRLSLDEAGSESFSDLNIVALFRNQEREHSSCERAIFGLGESSFRHEAGMITKMEVRAVALANLKLEADLVMWDLGAASGSVSIEAARLVPLKRVFAVEKNSARFSDLVENVKRFRLPEIEPVLGNSLEAVSLLPDPDRVFIGGSGGDLREILSVVESRLRPGGRVVQTVVTLDSLDTARAFWSQKPFDTTVTQLQINRSVPIGKTQRFESLNPVFIIAASRRP